LLEILAKTPAAFEKHWPTTAIAVIRNAGTTLPRGEFSHMSTPLQESGRHLETFDAGSVLLVAHNADTEEKLEITVDNDDLRGDEEEFQLAVHMHQSGKPAGVTLLTCDHLRDEIGCARLAVE